MKILNRITYSYQSGGNLYTAQIDYIRRYSLTSVGAARIMRKDGQKFVSIHSIDTFVDER